jgi:hypothetical protein
MNLKNFIISIMSKPSLYLKSLALLGLITILFSLNSFGQDFQKTGKAKYISFHRRWDGPGPNISG